MSVAQRSELPPEPAARRVAKSAAAFRTISEVATDLDVPPHVLRFWESKFPQIKPLKRGGGRRYYRPEDIELLRRIRALLYREGYTIKGVQKLLRVTPGKTVVADEPAAPELQAPAQLEMPTPPRRGRPAADAVATRPAAQAAVARGRGTAAAAALAIAPAEPLSAAQRAAVEAAIEELEEIRQALLWTLPA